MRQEKSIEGLPETEGLIVKATGGFYYVHSAEGLLECRARGVFRKRDMTPLVGDRVRAAVLPEEKGYLLEILPRQTLLTRPPLANLEQLALVSSVRDPAPNLFVLDKLIAAAEHREIEPLLVFTKTDLADAGHYAEIYRRAGFSVWEVCAAENRGVGELREALSGRVSAFAGNSGVGKSSLLNALFPQLGLSTAEISKKLGRGRHTTRHVELFALPEGGWVADTPGFSALELEGTERIPKEELAGCFREFSDYLTECRFTGCAHVAEKGCAVRAALEEGKIAPSRHQSYCALYEQARQWKEWEWEPKD